MAQLFRKSQPTEACSSTRKNDATSPLASQSNFYEQHVSEKPRSNINDEVTFSDSDRTAYDCEYGLDFDEKERLHASPSPSDELFVGTVTTTTTTATNGNMTSGPAPSEGPSIVPTWTNMPNKCQLAILAASRFVDFFQMAALQTYMVHQLKSFDPKLPDSTISHQAGILQGAFTAAQIITSILWGRAADRPSIGRKTVLNIGLIGTGIGCIGVGFSKSYGQAVFWRFLSGAVNGTVGSARTMVAEKTPKPWHPRAFLLLPAAFNVANVLGPILAGMLVEPCTNFAYLFGPNSMFGGSDGVVWMKTYPYALANLLSTALLFAEALLVHLYLVETLKEKQGMARRRYRPGRYIRRLYETVVSSKDRQRQTLHETQRHGLLNDEQHRSSIAMKSLSHQPQESHERRDHRLPFWQIWTPNVLWTLLSVAIFDFHMGAFASLWLLFLATPRDYVNERIQSQSKTATKSILKFASGLAFPPSNIGYAMSIIGFIGVALQFLLYPWANSRFGLMRCFRASLFLFPLAYALAPFIALVPSTTLPPQPSAGFAVWIAIACVLFLQVAARTFALPASIILLNNSSPHPSVLATIHGIGQACSATFRTAGPMLAGYWYGVWTERGVVGMAWWITASIAALGCIASFWVRNGSGHEILLPGEDAEWRERDSQPRPKP